MLFWWRVWHHRNDTIFAKGKEKNSHSARFLQNYLENVCMIKNGNSEISPKGESPMIKLPRVKEHVNVAIYGRVRQLQIKFPTRRTSRNMLTEMDPGSLPLDA